MSQRRAIVALAGSAVALGVLLLGPAGATSGISAQSSHPSQVAPTALLSSPTSAEGLIQRQASCLDLPISSAVIQPSSCWDTGPTSMLIAGTAPDEAGAGAVAVIDGQSQSFTNMPDAGQLQVVHVAGAAACVQDARGGEHSVNLTDGQVAIAAAASCAAATSAAGLNSKADVTPDGRVATATLTADQLAPSVTPSYYEYYSYLSDCSAGATAACPLYEQGQQTTTPSQDGIVVLDFGAPCSSTASPAQYGVQLFESSSCTPDSSLQGLVQEWIDGYESAHGAGTPALTLAVGTSNSQNAIDPAPYEPASLALSAQAWYSLVTAPFSVSSAPLVLWSASDMEEASSGWWDGADTVSWVQDYSQAAGFSAGQGCALSQRGLLADYGDDILGGSGSGDSWSTSDVYDVSQGTPGACAVPEIYYASMATEWSALSQAFAQPSGAPGITFSGLMVEAVSGTLSGNSAWADLQSDTSQNPAIPAITQIAPYGDHQVQGPPPEVTAIFPDIGPAAGGQTITVTGQGFVGATALYFGTTAATSYQVISSTKITAVTPAGSGPTTITVTGPTGNSPASAGSTIYYLVASAYAATAPSRVLDTRPGSGQTGASHSLGPGADYTLNLEGVDGIPSGATAVVLNVTGVDASAATYITLYPAGGTLPTASNLNLGVGETIANLVTVALGSTDAVTIYNHAGTINVVADLEGWYAPGTGPSGLYNPVVPSRITDTRSGSGQPNAGHPLQPGGTLTVEVAGAGDIPSSGVAAVAMNVTAVSPTSSGYVTAYPAGSSQPVASNLNFVAGETVPNRVIVPLGSSGSVSFYNATGTTQLVVDVDGWFSATGGSGTGGPFVSIPPVRITDTRAGSGLPNAGATVAPEGSLVVQVAGVDGVPAMGQSGAPTAVVCNVTAIDGTASSYLTVYPNGVRPLASDLNWRAGATVTNLVLVEVSPSGLITLFNWAGQVNVVVDLEGWYTG
jgi:hypothetical protein